MSVNDVPSLQFHLICLYIDNVVSTQNFTVSSLYSECLVLVDLRSCKGDIWGQSWLGGGVKYEKHPDSHWAGYTNV